MGRIIDDLETEHEDIEEEGGLIMNKEFMMGVFQGIMDNLPPFEKYWTHMFQNNSMLIFGQCHSKFFHFIYCAMRYFHQSTTPTQRHLP